VTVVGEPELQERQELVSAPYAFTASTAIRAKHGVPPGTIAAWGGTAIPEGWVACDGAAYSTTAEDGKYQALFDAIQHTWGGAGEDFNVPNFGGRALMGDTSSAPGQNTNTDSSSAGVTPKTLGHLLGEETHRLTEAEMAAHTHSFSDKHYTGTQSRTGGDATARDNQLNGATKSMTNAGGIDTNNDITPDAAAPHNNMQPSTAVTFIIKY
jgi:microcystin-dependent protein